MKNWLAGILAFAALSCAPLRAQQPGAECDQTPPEHKIDRNGNVLPEYREWDWGQCSPGFPQYASGSVVSVQTLKHRPSNAARKEFDRGLHAWRKGQSDEAERHLSEAVRLDLNFLEAQIELASLLAESGRPARALEYFNSALAVDPQSALAYAGKASVLVMLNRPAEAEHAARGALELGSGLVGAHYMLAIALLMQDKLTPEAMAQMKIAATSYPRAQAYLESLQSELGRSQVQ